MSFEVKNINEAHAIMGENGSGKTSLLWALLLFCRRYNILCKQSQKEGTITVRINLDGKRKE